MILNKKIGTLSGIVAGLSYVGLARLIQDNGGDVNDINNILFPYILTLSGYYVGKHSEDARKWRDRANIDPLTGLYTRRYVQDELERLIDLKQRKVANFGVYSIDVVGLKEINDTQGHAAGDKYLQDVAKFLQYCTRSYDIIGRMGGDEFIILSPNLPPRNLTCVKEKILSEVEKYNKSNNTNIRISIGARSSGEVESLESIVELADYDMYKHKQEQYEAMKHESRVRRK